MKWHCVFLLAAVCLLSTPSLNEARSGFHSVAKAGVSANPAALLGKLVTSNKGVVLTSERHALQSKEDIKASLRANAPLLFSGPISEKAKEELLFPASGDIEEGKRTRLPIHSKSDSWYYFVDAFYDSTNRTHFRVIDYPKSADETEPEPELVRDYFDIVGEYLTHCAVDELVCTAHMNNKIFKKEKGQDISMDPPQGAVFRSLDWTTVSAANYQWNDGGFPFPPQQFGSRIDVTWYLYVQAPPSQLAYLVYALINGQHSMNTPIDRPSALGYYMSNLELSIQAKPTTGVDGNKFYWVYSKPPTQNNNHQEGQTSTISDQYSASFNLGFSGENVNGGFSFSNTQTFTTSYTVTTDITDWSVAETSDPVTSSGSWKYYQSWPVDMSRHNLDTFAQDWEKYYSSSWKRTCAIKEVPNLSRFTMQTHTSMMWHADPSLRTDPKTLNLDVWLPSHVVGTALTCTDFNGHHMMSQGRADFNKNWVVNVADVANMVYH